MNSQSHIALLEHIAKTAPQSGMSLRAILTELDERAFGAMLFLLAMPCAIPFLYGVPQIVAVPMLVLAGQIMMGRRHPWLPEKLAARHLSKASLERAAKVSRKWFGWTEWIVLPRLKFLTGPTIMPVLGVFLCAFCASILVPLPLTNSVPAMAVAIVAAGFMARDGLLTLLGVIIGSLWVSALIFFGELAMRQGVSFFKTLLGGG